MKLSTLALAAVPALLAPAFAFAPQGTIEQRRILILRDGSCIRALARDVDGGIEYKSGATAWKRVDACDVITAQNERDAISAARALLRQIEPRAYGSRVEACGSMIANGLDAEAASELDLVLTSMPDERHALALLRATPPRIDLECTPGANESARTALLRAGARQCNLGSSPVRRELIVRALARDAALTESVQPALASSGAATAPAQTPTLADDLVRELGSSVTTRRTFACLALRRLCATSAIGPLAVHAVLDPSLDVRDGAILGLRDAHDPRACAAVVRALANPSALVRSNAAEALGRMGYTEAIEPLIMLMSLASAAPAGGSGGGGPVRANFYSGLQTAYVQDFNVEIAQGSSIADPIVQALQTGVVFDVGVGGVSSQPITTEVWNASRALVRLTGARIGVDPPAWKTWWDENRGRFVPGAKAETGTSAPAAK